jgi:hypothetical protein
MDDDDIDRSDDPIYRGGVLMGREPDLDRHLGAAVLT